MNFSRYIAFSIVASSVLCGAQSYNDWGNTTFSDGDTVNISYESDPTKPNQTLPILKQGITLASGTLNVTVNAIASKEACGIIACLSSSTTFGSTGSTINFNVTGGIFTSNPAAFDITSGGLTVESNIKVTASGNIPAGIFRAQNGANLTFNGNVELSGASTAITMGNGTLAINQSGGKSVNISGAISLNGGTTNIKLDNSDDKINGAITANGGSTTLDLSGGSQINGAFTGNGNGTLNLTIDNSTYKGNVTNAGTSNVTINGGGKLEGKLTTSGNSLKLDMDNGTITNGVTSTASTNTITLKNGSKIESGGLSASGSTNSLTINDTGASITGDVSLTANNGGSNTTSLTKATITGNLTLSGTNKNPILITNSTITGTITTNKEANFGTISDSTLGQMSHSSGAFTATLDKTTITNGITSNAGNAKNSLTVKGGSTVGDVSLTTTNNQEKSNNVSVNSGKIGNLTLQAGSGDKSNSISMNNGSTIQKVTTTGAGGLSFLLNGNSSVTEGIHTSAQSTKVDIAVVGNSKINGTSELGGADEVRVIFKGSAGAETLNFKGNKTNNLAGRNGAKSNITAVTMQGTTNQVLTESTASLTIGSLSMNGQHNNIAQTDGNTTLQQDGANLTITGSATITATTGGKNQLAFKQGNIVGSLTTQGETLLHTLNSYHIQGGVIHSNGKFDAVLHSNSQISNGIQTSGTGDADVKLKDSSKLNGDSNFATQTNTVTLTTSSQINGNTTFSGTTNTLAARDSSHITGQLISANGTTTHTLKDNAIVQGGIDTQNGAGKTTANFNDSSTLQNGTSTFHSNIDITFANNSKAIDEAFNVNGGTANITFKDQAEMQGGKITTNNGGTSNIKFQDNSKMVNGEIETTGGTTNLTAQNNAQLSNKLTQSGGDFTANFNNNSTFTGNATQSGGTSDITFKDNAKWTGHFNQTGGGSKSNITFHGSANMQGNITTSDGETNITFDNRAWIEGNITAGGTKNQVTFTDSLLKGNLTLDGTGGTINGDSQADITSSKITGNIQGYDKVDITIKGSEVDGYLHQGGSYHTQGMKATITDSWIKGGFEGNNDQTNTLTVTNSKIDNGVKQSQGFLNADIKTTIVTGGFSGTNNSQNTVNMLQGSLTGGISQNTGSLDFKSQMTDISGGFTGMNSTNTLKMANGNFNDGKITQVLGSLTGEIIMTSGLGDFGGESSNNVIHLSNSKIKNIVQSGGSLEFNTNADVEGKITGDRGSNNKISVVGAKVHDKITQTLGSMDLILLNSNAQKEVESMSADFGLYATNATIEGDISLKNSASNGISDNLTLNGKFTQSNGTSTMTFSNTNFMKETTISNAISASLIFTRSKIQNIEATRGVTAFNLADSEMTSFNGNMGQHSITLVHSKATTFNQRGGTITLNASNNSEATSVTGGDFSNVSITLDRSKITGNVSNNGETTISMQDSNINGSVTQTGTSLSFTASNSTLKGQYKQTDGTSMVNFMNSKIEGGIDVKTLDNGTMNFTQGSQIQNGLKAEDSRFTFMLLSGSTLEGGFTQNQGAVTGTIDESALNGEVKLSSGSTNLSLHSKATINGNITATDHNTTILVDNSTINGNMNITGGSFDLTAQNNSTINGNGGGGKSQVNVNNADFKLTLDTNSTFNGDITQTNNNQTIIVKQNSTLDGSITNTNVTSSISVNNATITGDISQTGGSLALDLSNNGKIGGDITLKNSNTILSGSGTGNEIGGNFTQTNGSLTGSITGLTLNGSFSQTGGTSSVSFINSVFTKNTEIKDATSSSLTFDNSTLKGYTTDGGADNTLKLINDTKMNGTLTLKNQAQTTLTMDGSTLTGDNNTAITASDNSFLTFNTKNSTIIGEVKIDTGGLKGTADNTDINGNITLTNTNSDVSFTNTTKITGNLTATNGDNTIKLDNSSITGSVSQTGGTIKLDLSNGSGIGGNLTFSGATATLTGKGAGNRIDGEFDSINTTLTGDASGLTLTGTFTQSNGSSDIIFRNESNFKGAVSVTGATSSNLQFTNQSGINNTINITNGTNNAISLSNNSFINGKMTLQNTTATISASNNSSITGDLDTTGSNTTLSLSGSAFVGATTQTNGTLNVNATGNSTLKSDMTLNNGSTNISLSDRSNLTGTITANENNINFTLRDSSSFNSMENPQDIKITNADFTLNASNNSVFGGNLTHTSNNGNHSANLSFSGNSFYSGTMDFKDITVNAKFNQSGIFSNSVKITGKSALFEFDGSTNGGVIGSLTASNTSLTINTTNQSHITINDLNITGNTLNLNASNSSRLTANVTLNNQTIATYTATTNGNLNVNTRINNQASTLTVTLNGGMMQGAITQDPNGANGFPNGEITLQSSGDNGGRWAVTDDSQVKELTLNNTQEALFSNAIFASAFNSPLSFVDFTLEFNDNGMTSRVGKEIIRKPEPINGQPIPDAGDGRTYMRQLQVNEIKGDNGLFRVYADLGTNLADNILASKASGNHLIQVQYRADTFRDIGGDRIVVAKVTDPSTTVSFKGTQSEIGLTKYDTEIIKENAADGRGFEWIIGQATPSGMSYSSKIIASILQSQYRTFMVEIDSLDRRLGDLEFIKRDKGFWIRSYVGSNTKEATDFSTLATDNYYSIWSGFDYNSIGLTVHNYVGVFFNYTGINTESKDYVGKSSNIAFGIYNTFKANSGFYADILAKYIYTMSDFEISNYSLAKNSPKIDNHKFLLNAEIGYSFYYGEKRKSGYIEPQFQVTSGYIHKSDLSVVDVSGETIHASIGRNFPVSIRAGAFWGQVFGEKIKSHIKLGTSFVYDVDSGGILNFSDSSTELQFKQGSDFRWVLSARSDFTFGEFFKLYASFDTSFFGNYNTTYSANLGIRFIFGRSNNYVRHVPVVYSPYTPPVSIDDDKRTVPVVKRYTTKDIDQNYVGKPRKVESYIQGNVNPNVQQGSPTYAPSRKPHRDITSEVEF